MQKQEIKTTIDRKEVSRKEFEAALESKQNKHTIITGNAMGDHIFSSFEDSDKFVQSDPTFGPWFTEAARRRERALKVRDEKGDFELKKFLMRRSALYASLNELTTDFLGTYDLDTYEDEADLIKSIVGPRFGSVQFFKSFNYQNRFRYWEGYNHMDIEFLEGDDNTLSSIRAIPTIYSYPYANWPPYLYRFFLTLYDEPCWSTEGRSVTYVFNKTQYTQINLQWFNNITSSWRFHE